MDLDIWFGSLSVCKGEWCENNKNKGKVVFLFEYTKKHKIMALLECSHLTVGIIGAFEPCGYAS